MSRIASHVDNRRRPITLTRVFGAGVAGGDVLARTSSVHWPANPTDTLFIKLLQDYRCCGGLLRLRDLQAMRRASWTDETLTQLPALIVARRAVGLVWDRTPWIPAFQFDDFGCVTPAVEAVLRELTPAFNEWELSGWFVTPSCWLDQRRPVDLIDANQALVFEAARVDRYVATGG